MHAISCVSIYLSIHLLNSQAKSPSMLGRQRNNQCFLVDEGKISTLAATSHIWRLPDELKDLARYPFHAAEVILLELAPCDKNPEWTVSATKIVRRGLLTGKRISSGNEGSEGDVCFNKESQNGDAEYDEPREIICRSRTSLVLGSTIWGKQAQVLEKLRSHDIDGNGKVCTKEY